MEVINNKLYIAIPITLAGTRYNALDSYCRELHKKKRTKVFIAKPPNGAMGVG